MTGEIRDGIRSNKWGPAVRVVFWALAALVCLPAFAQAQLNASIDGKVLDAGSGGPVPGVRVTLAGTGTRVVTDGNGAYRFDNLAPGSYQLWLVRAAYLPLMRKVELAPGQVLHLNLNLEPEAIQAAPRPIVRRQATVNQHFSFSLAGGLSHMLMNDYNHHVATQQKLAASRFSDEDRLWSGHAFHRGYSTEFQVRYALSPSLAVALGSGRIAGETSSSSQVSAGGLRYDLSRRLRITAIPVDLIAYAIYPYGDQSFYLGIGFSRFMADLSIEDKFGRYTLGGDEATADSSWSADSHLSASDWGTLIKGGYEVRLGEHFSLIADCLMRWAPVSGFTGTRKFAGEGSSYSESAELIFRRQAGTVMGTASYLEVVPRGETFSFESVTRDGRVEFSGFYFRLGAAVRL